MTLKREGGTMEYDWIPLIATLAQVLLSHLNEHQITDIVFRNLETKQSYSDRGGLCTRAKVKHFGTHAIRHLSASILAREGVPLPVIQLILRHEKITTTQRYFHPLGLKEELRRVMDQKAKENLKSIYVGREKRKKQI